MKWGNGGKGTKQFAPFTFVMSTLTVGVTKKNKVTCVMLFSIWIWFIFKNIFMPSNSRKYVHFDPKRSSNISDILLERQARFFYWYGKMAFKIGEWQHHRTWFTYLICHLKHLHVNPCPQSTIIGGFQPSLVGGYQDKISGSSVIPM